MRITTKDQLLALLEWAAGGGAPMLPLDTDPPVDSPERYGRSDPTYGPPPYPAPHRPMEQTHFYYVGMGARNSLRTLVYWLDKTDTLPEAQFEALIADARAGGNGATGNKPARRFSDVGWRKPGFLVFLVDLPGWSLLEMTENGVTTNRALYFAEVKDSNGNSTSCRNHSFFNARTMELSIGAEAEKLKLLVVENHHLKAVVGNGGSDYKPRDESSSEDNYKYDIFLTLAVEHGNADDIFPIVLDPGGKNIGPP